MFKKAFSLILVLFTFSCFAVDKHIVFLVHGIAGKPENFGSLEEIIKEQHKSFDKNTLLKIEKFKYQTQNNTIDVNDISLQLAKFVDEKIRDIDGLAPNDKISFIVHSQGGLITTRYLLRSAMGDVRYHKKYFNNFYSFITLGTPFWGSKIAILGSKIKALARFLGLDILTFFGSTQLTQMEVTAPAIDELRYLLLEPFAQTLMEKLQSQIKFLHFAGIPEPLKILKPFVTGRNQFEDDTAVPLPSTQLDFIYYVENADHKNKSVINPEDFYSTNFSHEDNFYPINAFHTKIIKDSLKVHGISFFPKGCLGSDYVYCPHPALAPLIETLFDLRKSRRPRTDFTSFAFDLRLRFNEKISKSEMNKLKIKIKSYDRFTKIGKPSELFKRVRRFDETGNHYLYHTGFIANPDRENGVVGLEISVPGHGKKTVKIPVEKGRTTFLDLTLLRIH